MQSIILNTTEFSGGALLVMYCIVSFFFGGVVFGYFIYRYWSNKHNNFKAQVEKSVLNYLLEHSRKMMLDHKEASEKITKDILK